MYYFIDLYIKKVYYIGKERGSPQNLKNGGTKKVTVLEQLKEKYDDELLAMCQEANSYDGSFDFCQIYDLEELAENMDAYELARAIIYGDVHGIVDPVRFNGYGNLETVNSYMLVQDIRDYYLEELADWLENHEGIAEEYGIEVEENDEN